VTIATIGLYGALLHTVNHATFKSLLFLNAGSVLRATGTQELNRLGGLVKFMPVTAATALVASFSIAGVPLFNGFASKWTIFVSTILGSPQAGYLAVFAVVGILTSAITLASFMKFFGVTFLSRTSALVTRRAAQRSLEAGWTMQVPQTLLALACVGVGLAPALAFQALAASLATSGAGLGALLAGPAMQAAGLVAPWAVMQAPGGQAVLAPLVLAAVLGVLMLVVYLISRIGAAERRTADIWLCGYVREAEVHRYVAHGFYGDTKRRLRWFGGMPRRGSRTMKAG
jgi:formate hydrogenlyase subunit 3/multisubunit Na+/H+ antiporter MnhD subunit